MELKVKVGGVEMSIEEAISIGNNDPGIYGFRFDENSPMWTKEHEWNRIYLRTQQDYMNVMLRLKGHLFLNEVYDALGVPRTTLGQMVGWIYNDRKCVDLNIINEQNLNRIEENVFYLYPNVDGYILDKI